MSSNETKSAAKPVDDDGESASDASSVAKSASDRSSVAKSASDASSVAKSASDRLSVAKSASDRSSVAKSATLWVTQGVETNRVDVGSAAKERGFKIGSQPDADLQIKTLEPDHLVLTGDRGRVWVESQGAPLQTQLNNAPMATGIRMPFRPQDVLDAGGVIFRLAPENAIGVRLQFDVGNGFKWERVVKDIDFTLGRSRDCDVVIPRGRVSREHARVVYREGRLMVVDLRSTTGTSVNRERIVHPHILVPGDIVGIDGVRIEMSVSTDRTANPFDDVEPPAWLFDGDANDRLATLADGLPVEDDAPVTAPRFALDLRFAGTELGVYEVVDSVVVGRAETCSLAIDTPALSPKHAQFVLEGGSLFVKDLGTSRGTYVNGRRVTQTALLEGDRVELGPVTFVVVPLSESDRPKAPTPNATGARAIYDRTAEGMPVVVETIRSAEAATKHAENIVDGPDGPPTLRTVEDDDTGRSS